MIAERLGLASRRKITTPPLVVAVPELDRYHEQSGIGRVLLNLRQHWHAQVRMAPATFVARRLPLLRNLPTAVQAPADADLILLPQISGASALSRTGGIPSVAIVHDVGIVDFPGDTRGMDWLTRQTITRHFQALRHASRIVTVSAFTQARLTQYLPEVAERSTTIPDGISEHFLTYRGSQAEAQRAIEDLVARPLGSPVLLYVGSELPRKNLGLLLEVLRAMKATLPDAQLLKVGKAGHPRWRAATLRRAKALGLTVGEDVLLVGGVDDATLAHAYRAADLFVSTSLYEGFGLPAIEAMAIGTPAIVTNRAAFPEVVGDAGLVVEPSVAAFLQAIEAALHPRMRDDLVHKGRARAVSYGWPRLAERYLKVLSDVSQPRSAGGTTDRSDREGTT